MRLDLGRIGRIIFGQLPGACGGNADRGSHSHSGRQYESNNFLCFHGETSFHVFIFTHTRQRYQLTYSVKPDYCMYVSVRSDYEAKEQAIYTILGYDLEGRKEILGLWMGASESKNYWMQVFDEIKGRGVEDVFFISMDGVSGLESGAKAIFPGVVVQRCIVHLIRNSIKYVPTKDYKKFTADLKKVYGAPSLKAAKAAFETFQTTWKSYPGAVDIWTRNFQHVEQLFDYGNAVRKIMYTTNAIESVNSAYKKLNRQRSVFPSPTALMKSLYLSTMQVTKKWTQPLRKWGSVYGEFCIMYEDRMPD